jgi:hypothetical protein
MRSHYENICRVTADTLDPFDVSVWPTRRFGKTQAEIRYQFLTRNCRFIGFLKPLSHHFPALTFVLVTLPWRAQGKSLSARVRRGLIEKLETPT